MQCHTPMNTLNAVQQRTEPAACSVTIRVCANRERCLLLQAGVRAMISNAAFAFPLIKDYEAVGAELVLFGSREGVLSGDSWSAFLAQRSCL